MLNMKRPIIDAGISFKVIFRFKSVLLPNWRWLRRALMRLFPCSVCRGRIYNGKNPNGRPAGRYQDLPLKYARAFRFYYRAQRSGFVFQRERSKDPTLAQQWADLNASIEAHKREAVLPASASGAGSHWLGGDGTLEALEAQK